jgi:hypothetical protein
MNRHRSKLQLLGSLALVLLVAAVAEACPTCKDTLAGDPAQQGLAKGIYYSILLMMAMPFFLLGSLSAYFYYLVRRDQAEKAKQQAIAPPQMAGSAS